MSYRQIPNRLTISRIIIAAPFFLLAYCSADNPWCHAFALLALVYIIATDILDGRLARRWNAISPEGETLDPIADKVVVAVAYIAIASLHKHWALPILTATMIIRDLLVSLLRDLASKAGMSIPARKSGKLRTILSMGLALVLLARTPYVTREPPWVLQWLYDIPSGIIEVAIWTLMVWTLYTLYDYGRSHPQLLRRIFRAPCG